MLGERPSSATAPSICGAAVATPRKNGGRWAGIGGRSSAGAGAADGPCAAATVRHTTGSAGWLVFPKPWLLAVRCALRPALSGLTQQRSLAPLFCMLCKTGQTLVLQAMEY